MVNGFSVELNINGRILEYDDGAGLLSCSIPKEMSTNISYPSFGVLSQKATVEVEDYNLKLRKSVVRNQISGQVFVKIYYNDILQFQGVVTSDMTQAYNNANNTMLIEASDYLYILQDKYSDVVFGREYVVDNIRSLRYDYSPSELARILFSKIAYEMSNVGIQISYSLDYDIDTKLGNVYRETADTIFFISGDTLWNELQSFAEAYQCCIYMDTNTIYVRSVIRW